MIDLIDIYMSFFSVFLFTNSFLAFSLSFVAINLEYKLIFINWLLTIQWNRMLNTKCVHLKEFIRRTNFMTCSKIECGKLLRSLYKNPMVMDEKGVSI